MKLKQGLSDIEIARETKMKPVIEIAKRLGLGDDDVSLYGKYKAKIHLEYLQKIKNRPDGKLILVTAMTPTPAGEGKTTTTVSLGDGLNRLGRKTIITLREPSLGPCFGMKGGAAGGGYAQVVPMEDINLHFTGDFHSIDLAHNLLSSVIDNHIHHGNELKIDGRRVTWRRVMDMNDRALRNVIIGLGGTANGEPRESGFDITVASEVMAIFCLSEDIFDMRARLGKIVIGENYSRQHVTAGDLKVNGAMTVLLKNAINPNLVQTLENNPAIIHGGPFANIAHGCNSIIATKLALKLADYVVTEAGFGADLGAEKFINIKCRKAGLYPNLAVIVASLRALKTHGGVPQAEIKTENPAAVRRGFRNLARHIRNMKSLNVPVVVSLNHFTGDYNSEINIFEECMKESGVPFAVNRAWAEGSKGATGLAETALSTLSEKTPERAFTYPDDLNLWDKTRRIAQEIYGARDIEADTKIRTQFKNLQEKYPHFPVCMAKTQYSFSTDPKYIGAPEGHNVQIREVRLAAGAGFIVVITGDIMTMPGLPKNPAAESIDINENGETVGLF